MNESNMLEIERVVAAARDSLTDEMVTRLSSAVAEGLDLLDRANRADLGRAIPELARLVANGDLERLTNLARMIGAAEDAVTEEMVVRIADTLGNALSIADRLQRAGADRLVGALERIAASGGLEHIDSVLQRLAAGITLLDRMLYAIDQSAAECSKGERSRGGIGAIWRLLAQPANQDTLRYLLAVGGRLKSG